jgi:hypothetical protein
MQMAGEKITFNILNQQFDPLNSDILLVEIFCRLSSPIGGVDSVSGICPIDASLTESQIQARLVDFAAEIMSAQVVPQVFTAADVRRAA